MYFFPNIFPNLKKIENFAQKVIVLSFTKVKIIVLFYLSFEFEAMDPYPEPRTPNRRIQCG